MNLPALTNIILAKIYPLLYLGSNNPYRIDGYLFNLRKNSHDKISVWGVWKTNTYFDNGFQIKKHDTVVDIGAHIGAFAIKASSLAAYGKVYAYEPNVENYQFLTSNSRLNNLKNLIAINCAVSSENGFTRFYIANTNNTTHSLYPIPKSKRIKVKTVSLKNLIKKNHIQRINYLKIDAEGAEYKILLHTPPAIFKKIDKIVLEYHDFLTHGHSYHELIRILTHNGFEAKTSGFLKELTKTGIIKAIKT